MYDDKHICIWYHFYPSNTNFLNSLLFYRQYNLSSEWPLLCVVLLALPVVGKCTPEVEPILARTSYPTFL